MNDGLADVMDIDALLSLKNARLAVGAAGGKSAWLLYLHANGSPGRGIPPRPVLEPALNDPGIQEAVAGCFAEAAVFAIEGDPGAAEGKLNEAGALAEEAVKAYFDSGKLAANAAATAKIKGKNAPLIDTGGLRASITHRIERG